MHGVCSQEECFQDIDFHVAFMTVEVAFDFGATYLLSIISVRFAHTYTVAGMKEAQWSKIKKTYSENSHMFVHTTQIYRYNLSWLSGKTKLWEF